MAHVEPVTLLLTLAHVVLPNSRLILLALPALLAPSGYHLIPEPHTEILQADRKKQSVTARQLKLMSLTNFMRASNPQKFAIWFGH